MKSIVSNPVFRIVFSPSLRESVNEDWLPDAARLQPFSGRERVGVRVLGSPRWPGVRRSEVREARHRCGL